MIFNKTYFLLPLLFVLLICNISSAQYSISVSPANATVNDNITITFTDDDLVNDFYTDNQSEIYLYSWLFINSDEYNNGNINNREELDAAPGGNGTFTVTINPATALGLPNGEFITDINLLFINQYGPGGNDQTEDLYIDLVDATVSGGGTGGSMVVFTPSTPTDTEQVTIDFDATGTDLAGASQVFIHSGVSTTEDSPTSFNRVVGNWGQNDGVGEMTSTGTDTWQIVLPSLRSVYGVETTEDVFGFNFLFRSVDGMSVESNGGANFFNPVDPGNYFSVIAPEYIPHLAEVGTPFSSSFTANTAPLTWTLEEVDANGNALNNLVTQNGSTTLNYDITLDDTNLKRYKITADFGSGVVKYKFIEATGYHPVNLAPRPSWTTPGINYHENDPTKATLVLHTPTYTRYNKRTRNPMTVTGVGNTTPKEVVYVVGDFNNWTPSEAYKLNRDRDGWNGSIDADGDDDRGDYWWIELTGLTPGQEYIFQYYMNDGIQIADPYTEKVSDFDDVYISNEVYPNLITYPSEHAVDRASVLQTGQNEYNWTAPSFVKPTDNNLNIYELHFRDFTEEGTYLAAIDKLDYIKELGINAIHVMPVSEFEGNSSWGYNPNFYFAPDKAYGTKDDLKQFIDACHHLEIQVFNDLVLNHAFFSNVMGKLYWNKAANKPASENPWLNADHKMIADEAGWWGMDWNHESEHTQNMMDRVLDFWLQEYNFDGFRFDFTKGFGQSGQDGGDPWASSKDDDRIQLLKGMIDGMWARNPGSVAIFEHLAHNEEDKILADYGILMWSGQGHHGDLKNFVLGWNGDNTDIYNSGIYNASERDFSFANWISYGESHDEQRLGYELITYGNDVSTEPNPDLKVQKMIDRLKIAYAFNLLFPGPRMLWQFGELGYEIDIDFNGRTGEKPVHWEYADNPDRKELYQLISKIFALRNNYNLYATAPDYGNIGTGAGQIHVPRRMELHDGNGHHVIVIANLDTDAAHTVSPGYDVTGTWYKYNGETGVDGTTYDVNSTNDTYTLQPSEVFVLTNFEMTSALAVEVLDFEATVKEQDAVLKWTTVSEHNNKGFYIEKSTDGIDFKTLDFVAGQTIQKYEFVDNNFDDKAYYRLRQLDTDGKETISKTIVLTSVREDELTFEVYPNPVTRESIIKTNLPILDTIQMELINATGEQLMKLDATLDQVNLALTHQFERLGQGIYFVRIFDGQVWQTIKVVR